MCYQVCCFWGVDMVDASSPPFIKKKRLLPKNPISPSKMASFWGAGPLRNTGSFTLPLEGPRILRAAYFLYMWQFGCLTLPALRPHIPPRRSWTKERYRKWQHPYFEAVDFHFPKHRMVGILVSFLDGLYYSGVMLVSGSVNFGGVRRHHLTSRRSNRVNLYWCVMRSTSPKRSIELMYLATNFLCKKSYTQFCWLIDQPHYINGINYHGTLREPLPRTPPPPKK